MQSTQSTQSTQSSEPVETQTPEPIDIRKLDKIETITMIPCAGNDS